MPNIWSCRCLLCDGSEGGLSPRSRCGTLWLPSLLHPELRGGMRLLPKSNAMAAALRRSPSALPALFSWVSRSSQDLLCFPGYKAKQGDPAGSIRSVLLLLPPSEGAAARPVPSHPPARALPAPFLSESSAAWDGRLQFSTPRSCSTCGTATGVREQPEDGRCLCEDGRGLLLGQGPPAQHLLSPVPPFPPLPPKFRGLCELLAAHRSPFSPAPQLPELWVRAGPAPCGAPKFVSGALCKVTLNMQHLHKYIYICTVRCVGPVRAVGAPGLRSAVSLRPAALGAGGDAPLRARR